MEVHRGKSRIAFVGERFTLKVPNPNTFRHFADILEFLKFRDFKELYHWFQYSEGNYCGFRWAISGFLQNWREFMLSKELGEIVVPTRLSVLGLLNIQDTSTDLPATINNGGLFATLGVAIGTDIMRDTHTFHETDNFGIHDGQAKIRDYGGPKTGPILKKHFDAIKRTLESLIGKPE